MHLQALMAQLTFIADIVPGNYFFVCVLLCKALLTVLTVRKPLVNYFSPHVLGNYFIQHVKMLEHSTRNTNSPSYGLNCDSSAPCLTSGIVLMSSYIKIMPLPICHIERTALNETLGIV